MEYVEHVVDLVGNTPLVKLNSLTTGIKATVLAKVEYLNPGGSVKDRIALRMVEAAEKSGELQPGGTIVEPTSGNTGVGLALVAQRKGYKCVFVCPDKVSEDKRNVLKAYGAEVVVCPTAVAPEHPDSYYNVSDRLVTRDPRRVEAQPVLQPGEPGEPLPPAPAPRSGARPRAGSRTSSRASAPAARSPAPAATSRRSRTARVQVIGADPEGSVYSGGTGRPYLVEGVGEDFWPEAYDKTICDQIVEVSDADSFDITRRLAREEGLLVGGSCGMAAAAALRIAKDLPEDAVVVVLLPDGGRGYLSKVFNDHWMASYGFLPPDSTGRDRRRRAAPQGRHRIPDLVHAHPNETVARRRRDPARVRRLADARRQRRTAHHGGRGRGRGERARPARRAVHRQGAAVRPARQAHVAAAAHARRR